MNLPKLTQPIHELTLPSTGEKVLFRPFTVKEEKLLLMVIDDEPEAQVRALRQVLNNCLLPNKLGKTIDVSDLAIFDMDYIWLKIRSKSVEEIVTIPFECRQALPEGETLPNIDGTTRDYCGTVVQVPINLDKIEIKKNPKNTPKIELQDGVGILLRYPTFETLQQITKLKETNNIDSSFDVIFECTVMLFESNGKTYEKEHIDKKEFIEFLEALSQAQFQKIMDFFETLPVVRHEVHFNCPRCRHEADVVIEGTRSFLASDSAMKV
jgi:hypothetical protein